MDIYLYSKDFIFIKNPANFGDESLTIFWECDSRNFSYTFPKDELLLGQHTLSRKIGSLLNAKNVYFENVLIKSQP